MNYVAKVIADSVNPAGDRLTTMEVTYPRFVHAEMLTHRLFSRNSASSRAIPVEKMHANIIENPAGPVYWGSAKPGMQAGAELEGDERTLAQKIWLDACVEMLKCSRKLAGLVSVDRFTGELVADDHPNAVRIQLHKQIANRLTEPWMWITVIISATNYSNFFAQRCDKDAQPEIQRIAYMMRDAHMISDPQFKEWGEWHFPYLQPDEESLSDADKTRICIARCARVSYLNHDGKRDVAKDFELFERLESGGHFSPFEHVAAADNAYCDSNFEGWQQYRKLLPGECR